MKKGLILAIAWIFLSLSSNITLNEKYYEVRAAEQFNLVSSFGSEGAANGQFKSPTSIAVSPTLKTIFVADTGNNRIAGFTPPDKFSGMINKISIRPDLQQQFQISQLDLSAPQGVAVDPRGFLYVADTGNNRILKFGKNGAFQGSITTAGQQLGPFNSPHGLAIDPASNSIYAVDSGNNRIIKISSDGKAFSAIGAGAGSEEGKFNQPYAVSVDASGNIFVTDFNNHRVQKFSSTGTFVSKFGVQNQVQGQASGIPASLTAQEGILTSPAGISVDPNGNVYVADAAQHKILKFANDGTFLASFGTQGTGPGQLNAPDGVSVDPANPNRVYVVDGENNRVQVFLSSGQVSQPQQTTSRPPQQPQTQAPPSSQVQSIPTQAANSLPGIPASSVDIRMLPDSSPQFFKCSETPTEGSPTLPGTTDIQSSSITAVTDRDPNTQILGKAIFDITFSPPIVNNPAGPDIAVSEIGGGESFGVAALDKNSGAVSEFRTYSGSPTGTYDNCGFEVFESQVELGDFNVKEGDSLATLRIDNNGAPGCCVGADIGDIRVSGVGASGSLPPGQQGITGGGGAGGGGLPPGQQGITGGGGAGGAGGGGLPPGQQGITGGGGAGGGGLPPGQQQQAPCQPNQQQNIPGGQTSQQDLGTSGNTQEEGSDGEESGGGEVGLKVSIAMSNFPPGAVGKVCIKSSSSTIVSDIPQGGNAIELEFPAGEVEVNERFDACAQIDSIGRAVCVEGQNSPEKAPESVTIDLSTISGPSQGTMQPLLQQPLQQQQVPGLAPSSSPTQNTGASNTAGGQEDGDGDDEDNSNNNEGNSNGSNEGDE